MKLHEPATFAKSLAIRAHEIEAEIDRCWTVILAAATDAQVRHLLALETQWGDDGTLATRWTFSKFLKAMAVDPSRIGVNLDSAPYTCRCYNNGWIEDADTGDWTPCIACNQQMYELWSGGCLRPDHECERCAPGKRRRARGTSHADEVHAEQRETSARVEHDELFDAF